MPGRHSMRAPSHCGWLVRTISVPRATGTPLPAKPLAEFDEDIVDVGLSRRIRGRANPGYRFGAAASCPTPCSI